MNGRVEQDERVTTAETDAHHTEPTTRYWQGLEPPGLDPARLRAPFRYGYPARLPDGRFLTLPIRRQKNPERASASLIPNQASFTVIDALVGHMAELARPFGAEIVVAMPTLGMALAPDLARRLGHERYVPLGYSRKFWYRPELSEPVRSITSPDEGKTVWLDPNLVPYLEGRRTILVDDTVSSGTTAVSAIRLMKRTGADIVGVIAAMGQGSAWRAHLAEVDPSWPDLVCTVFHSPILRKVPGGWEPLG